MNRNTIFFISAAIAVGLVASACSSSDDSSSSTTSVEASLPSTTTSGTPAPTTATQPATPTQSASGSDLQSLIPTPAGTERVDGPDSIHDNGIHMHFLVTGAPLDVMNGYKTALEGGGWTLTVERSGGGGGGGGATYTGTNGDAYGVFTGGGYGNSTDVNSCAWPSKPAKTDCGGD